MRKKYLILLLATIAFYNATAQTTPQDPKALKILDAMSAYYQKLGAFKATFTYAIAHAQHTVKDEFQGEISIKGSQYRLILAGQEIVNNGKTMWNYSKDHNEVTINRYDPEEEDFNPAKIYTLYKQGYTAVYVAAKQYKKQWYHVIDLLPKDQDNGVVKIQLTIERKTKRLQSWTLFDSDGMTSYRYIITKFSPNVRLNDAYFNFNSADYPNIEVVDLR